MGSFFSTQQDSSSLAGAPSGPSRVLAFHSASEWRAHFNACKDSTQLEVAQEFKVEAMPTFVLIKQGKEVDKVVGAKKDELEKKILKHRGQAHAQA
uniref:Thioredoxin domain-containing protein n=1 Tax=Nelumbo nucifera TaxID=4432 RepID=A0A822YAL1_NELNU|nr:TPA_asm: hypothetical protein HUJ06_009985 [Nelumbo nucifera]